MTRDSRAASAAGRHANADYCEACAIDAENVVVECWHSG